MSEKITTSIVMTTYNGAEYVVQQLESLKNQTLTADEVIIADDCSTDNTVAIVKDYIKKNNLCHWIIESNHVNKGWRRNFIDTAVKAKGKYIFFCDQDDIWLTDKVQIMVSVMENHEQIDVLAGRYIRFQDTIPNEEAVFGQEIYPVKQDNHLLYTELPGCVFCVRKTFFDKVIPYWISTFSHDGFCWATAKLHRSAYILERPVIYWRKHYDSTYTVTSRQIKNRTDRIDWLKASQKNIECLKDISIGLNLDKNTMDKIERYSEFNQLRIEMLEKRKITNFFSLVRKLDCYNKKKQLLFEIYLALK